MNFLASIGLLSMLFFPTIFFVNRYYDSLNRGFKMYRKINTLQIKNWEYQKDAYIAGLEKRDFNLKDLPLPECDDPDFVTLTKLVDMSPEKRAKLAKTTNEEKSLN